jgi:hypothetical protein
MRIGYGYMRMRLQNVAMLRDDSEIGGINATSRPSRSCQEAADNDDATLVPSCLASLHGKQTATTKMTMC